MYSTMTTTSKKIHNARFLHLDKTDHWEQIFLLINLSSVQCTRFDSTPAIQEKPLLLIYEKYISLDMSEKYMDGKIATT